MVSAAVVTLTSVKVPTGRTGLVVPIPQAQALLAGVRSRFDACLNPGVPPHVTVLFPFVDLPRILPEDTAALSDVIGSQPAFEVTFARFGRFPRVLWLAPEPSEPFRRLTRALAARWPDHPPYGGLYPEVVPHLTVADLQEAQGDVEPVFAQIEAALAFGLPFAARVAEVHLLAFDGARFSTRARLPLG